MSSSTELLALLKRPMVTEKSTTLVELNQYTFEVRKDANKVQLAQAFELAFPGRKVQAVKLVKIPSHTKRYGKKVGRTPVRKKAIFSITGEPLELFTGVN